MPTLSMRGLVERTKQRLNLGEKTFKPTPNLRNPAMLQEAEDFERHLLKFKNHLAKYEKHLSAVMSAVPVVCRANLPRAWEAVEGTNMCEPVPPEPNSRHPHRVGGVYDELLMVDAAEIFRHRVDAILRPIDRWTDSLTVVKRRMARLEELRMQVDARRRRLHKRYVRTLASLTPGSAAAVIAHEELLQESSTLTGTPRRGGMRTPPGSTARSGGLMGTPTREAGVSSPASPAMVRLDNDLDEADEDFEAQRSREDMAREAISQQRQLDAVSESYREQEQLVFEQLSGLVRDAAYFKSYVAAALLVMKDSLQATLVALGPCKRPLPGFSEREPEEVPGVPAKYGRTADLMDMITALPPVVRAGGRQVPAGVLNANAMPPDSIRPKRVTAQPLQVAADDVSAPARAFEPVPDVAPAPGTALLKDIIGAEREGGALEAPGTMTYGGAGHEHGTGWTEGSGYGYGAPGLMGSSGVTMEGGAAPPAGVAGSGQAFPALQGAVEAS